MIESADRSGDPAARRAPAPRDPTPRRRTVLAVAAGAAAMAALAVAVSPLPAVSLRHAAFLLAGVAVAAAIPLSADGIGSRRGRRRVVRAWLVAHLGIGTAALVSAAARGPGNETAGVALLYLPLAAILAAGTRGRAGGRAAARAVMLLGAIVLVAVVAASGSRGGVLAAAAALPAGLAVLGPRGRRLAVAGLGAVVVAVAAAPAVTLELLTDGTPQGLVPRVLLSGRPEIWRRALLAIADFPLVGMGLGTFGPAVETLYPTATGPGTPLADAHQLFLQTALDLGVPGLVAVLVLLAMALRRLACAVATSRPDGPRRALAAGLLAALGGHLLWSLGDAVALGTPGSLALAATLGLAFALPTDRPPVARQPRRRWRAAVAVVALLVAALLVTGRHQVASTAAARAVLAAPDGEAWTALPRSAACRGYWLRGLAARAAGDVAGARREWTALVACAPRFLPQVAAAAPGDACLAAAARRLQPARPEPYLWQAELAAAAGDLAGALAAYRRATRLDPADGRAWLAYGRLLLAAGERGAARAAFTAACRHGDPGANACWLAGQVAEGEGDVAGAVAAYRRSRWEVARRRAAVLLAADGPTGGTTVR